MSLNSVSTTFIEFTIDELEGLVAVSKMPLYKFVSWKNFVENLPEVVDFTKDDICSICMEDFEESHDSEGGGKSLFRVSNRRVPCGHVYHSNCITEWLERCNSCPLCRHHISR